MGNHDFKKIYDQRSDLSTFLIHLTRDHEDETKAQNAFKSILSTNPYKLISKNPVGLFCNHPANANNFDKISAPQKSEYKTKLENFLKCICFTETPLEEIKNFIDLDLDLESGKVIKYSQYGFVFKKDFVIGSGGNPCFYVCTEKSTDLKSAFLGIFDSDTWWKFFEEWESKGGKQVSNPLNLIQFVNIFGNAAKQGKKIDFYWEREWRIPNSEISFKDEDVLLALCPEEEFEQFEKNFSKITFVSPKWSLAKMLEKLRDKPQPRH